MQENVKLLEGTKDDLQAEALCSLSRGLGLFSQRSSIQWDSGPHPAGCFFQHNKLTRELPEQPRAKPG